MKKNAGYCVLKKGEMHALLERLLILKVDHSDPKGVFTES